MALYATQLCTGDSLVVESNFTVALPKSEGEGRLAIVMLVAAACRGDLDSVSRLLPQALGTDAACAAFCQATAQGHMPLLRLFVQSGVEERRCLSYNMSPMQWAAEEGNIEAIEFLANNGSTLDPDEDRHFDTPLLIASARGHLLLCARKIVAP